MARGNTALAHVFEVEVDIEADAVAQDNVVPMSQRLTLRLGHKFVEDETFLGISVSTY